jgi:hypothetical protein
MSKQHIPYIIGLLARSRCGKDTVADYLLTQYPTIPFIKKRLATPIKEAVCSLYGFTHEQVEGPEKEEVDESVGISPRQAMVHLTHSVMDCVGTDFFSKRLFRDIDRDVRNHVHIIPDVRYPHDLDEIRRRGGVIVKIERDGINKHEWENTIDRMDGDIILHNNGTLESLFQQVRDVVVEPHYLAHH